MKSGYVVEVLTPKLNAKDPGKAIEGFEQCYRKVVDQGLVVSLPDNPMGGKHLPALEVIGELGLPAPAGQVLLHINTFHTVESLVRTLQIADSLNIDNLLLISGDGAEGLPRLASQELGLDGNTAATAADLLEYIGREYPGRFNLGVVFNPYVPSSLEFAKLARKAEAGATFVVTQPVVGLDMRLLAVARTGLPVYVGAWMSMRLELLSRCVGAQVPDWKLYDPMENLFFLRRRYRQWGLYLAALSFKTQFNDAVDLLSDDGAECCSCCGCG